MYLLRLAFKNLLRAKRRALLSSAAIVVGVFYLIVGQSFIAGVDEGVIYGVVHGTTSHVTIRPANYPTEGMDHPVDELVEITPELRAWLDEHTAAWTARTMFVGTVTSDKESLRIRVIGYDPQTDPEVFSHATWTETDPLPRGADAGVMLTSGTAGLLGVEKGDSIVIEARTHKGAVNAISAPIAAVSRTGNFMFDNAAVFMPEALVKSFLRTEHPTHVSMRLSNRDNSSDVKTELAALGGGAWGLIDWWDESKDLVEIGQIRRNALNVLVGMMMLMAAMAIANTILMAAHERTREIGTLRAMGMSKNGVLGLFLAEGSLLGLVAGSVGAAGGTALTWYLSRNPIDLNAMEGQAETIGNDVAYSAFIYVAFSVSIVMMPLLISILVALLASVYPARLASNMEPADAVRAE